MDHTTIFMLLAIVVVSALIFDFFNGFHDAANTISTIVVTRTMTPIAAVIMAGCFNFVGFWFGTAVAKTVGKGVVDVQMIGNDLLLYVLIAALAGAIAWNIITWLIGLPTSSSHALIGGLIGASVASAGFAVVNVGQGHTWNDLGELIVTGKFKDLTKTFGVLTIVAFIVIAPVIGFVISSFFTGLTRIIMQKANPRKADKGFKVLQVVAAIWSSIAHGTNDAQKSMGIIAMAMVAYTGVVASQNGVKSTITLDNCLDVHQWISVGCYLAISVGTMFGGWRIVKTMGTQITKIRPMEGFTSGTGAALTISACSELGIPVSTTHVIAGSIMGAGASQGAGKVRWNTARRIVGAWFLTIPATALCAALCFVIIKKIFI